MLNGAQHQPLVGKAVHLIDRASRSASGRTRRALRLTATDDPAQISRLLGVLYLCGSLLVILSLFLPHPDGTFELGLWAASAAAITVGTASLVWAKHTSAWSLHVSVALGTARCRESTGDRQDRERIVPRRGILTRIAL